MILAHAAKAQAAGRPVAMITLTACKGSTPRKPGARMLIDAQGNSQGTVGGGQVEHVLKEAAARVLRSGEAEMVTHHLTHSLGMCCGGQMSFFVEPLLPSPRLLLFGCGHVGAAVARAAAPLGFRLVGIDDVEAHTNPERLPMVDSWVRSYETADLRSLLPVGGDTYVLIATRSHDVDQKLLVFLLSQYATDKKCASATSTTTESTPPAFLGVIGSQRKAKTQQARLRAAGFGDDAMGSVHCPVGLPLGAETPEEIAVSVCAQLVQVRRRASTALPAQTETTLDAVA